jgi:hypothetical protein
VPFSKKEYPVWKIDAKRGSEEVERGAGAE